MYQSPTCNWLRKKPSRYDCRWQRVCFNIADTIAFTCSLRMAQSDLCKFQKKGMQFRFPSWSSLLLGNLQEVDESHMPPPSLSRSQNAPRECIERKWLTWLCVDCLRCHAANRSLQLLPFEPSRRKINAGPGVHMLTQPVDFFVFLPINQCR